MKKLMSILPFVLISVIPLSAQTRGFTLDFLSSHTSLHGLGLGLIGSAVAEEMTGGQLSVVFNDAGGEVRGIQAAGLFNTAGGSVIGAQLTSGFNIAGKDVRGIQAGTCFNFAEGLLLGVQTSTGFNIAGSVRGLQASVGFNIAGSVRGLQVSTGLNLAGNVEGFQTALVNVAGNVTLAQVGLVNVAKNVRFAQIGLVNIAEDVGIPVGLINIIENGQSRVSVSYDETGIVNTALKLGGRYFYNLYSFGVSDDGAVGLLEIGFGLQRRPGPLFLDLEITAGTLRPLTAAFLDENSNARFRARINLGMDVADRLSLIGGVSYNAYVTYGTDSLDFGPRNAFRYAPGLEAEFWHENHRIAVWPGLYIGVELR